MGAGTVARGRDAAEHLRRLVPVALVPRLVERRLERLWRHPGYRAQAHDQMEFLVGASALAPQVDELAHRYARHMLLRYYLRWHPREITRQRVRGIEWLTTARDPARPVLLSFAHHAQYDGLFGSLARHGVRLTSVMTPDMMGAGAAAAHAQHRRVVEVGTELVPATIGTEGIAALLRPGATVAIASDVPGRTPITWLGRRVLGSFGAARIATMTDSQVVLVRTRRDQDGPYLEVLPPLEPGAYPDPGALLDDVLRRHEEAVIEWPEAVEAPRARFGVLDEAGR